MADKIGNLAIVISGDAQNFMQVMSGVEQHLAAAQARMNAKSMKPGAIANGMGSVGTAIKAAAVGYLGKEFLDVGRNAIQMSRDLEVSEMQLKTLTGSAEAAKSVMADLKEFSSMTPFSTEEISGVARKLLGGGMQQGQAMTATKQIAAVSAGTGGELSSIARAYSQVVANGRFMTEELNQFADADFPIAEFAKTAKMSMGDMRDAMAKGLVPVEVMAGTFTRLTTEGGLFATALKDMAGTATGRAKADKAAHEAFMAAKGKELDDNGLFSMSKAWQAIEKGAITFQVWAEKLLAGRPDSPSADFSKAQGIKPIEDWVKSELAAGQNAEKSAAWAAETEKQRLAAFDWQNEMRAAYIIQPSVQPAYDAIKSSVMEGAKALKESLGIGSVAMFRASPFDNMPESIRSQMAGGNVEGAAAAVKAHRDEMARSFSRLPGAAEFGSSAAATIMNQAMNSIDGGKSTKTEDVLADMKRIEERNNDELKEIKKYLQAQATPKKAIF